MGVMGGESGKKEKRGSGTWEWDVGVGGGSGRGSGSGGSNYDSLLYARFPVQVAYWILRP